MNFLDEVTALNSPAVTNNCKVKLFVDSEMNQKDSDPVTLEQIKLARETNTLKAIHRALINRGFIYSDNTLANHLKGDCHCNRKKAE